MSDNKKVVNLIKAFGQIYKGKTNFDMAEIPEDERRVYTDNSTIIGVVPKKRWVVNMLLEQFEFSDDKISSSTAVRQLEEGFKKAEEGLTTIRTEYLKIIYNIWKQYDTVKIGVKKDYPLRIETEDFIIWVAPTVDN